VGIFGIINRDEYSKIESTNLSEENINGIFLLDTYDEAKIEKILGECKQKVEQKKHDIYIYGTEKFYVDLFVDEKSNIKGIYAVILIKEALQTSKDISKDSTPEDVKKAYGSKFLIKSYNDFMGSGRGYFIKYVDKENEIELQFDFSKDEGKAKLKNIRLFKY